MFLLTSLADSSIWWIVQDGTPVVKRWIPFLQCSCVVQGTDMWVILEDIEAFCRDKNSKGWVLPLNRCNDRGGHKIIAVTGRNTNVQGFGFFAHIGGNAI